MTRTVYRGPVISSEAMRFGVNTLIWTANFGPQHLDLFPRLKEGGFDGVEISLFSLAGFDTAGTRRRLEEAGLGVTMCSVLPGVSLLSEDAGERQRAKQHIADCASTLAELGGELLIGPLFSPVGYLPGRRRTQDE